MIFSETSIPGVYVVDIDRREDSRGYFARSFCVDEFSARGLMSVVAQASTSFNAERGTLRGLHFRYPPSSEAKYVRCCRGAIFDVVVDLRPESPTYLSHVMFELSAHNGRGLYIPERLAHGFVTLQAETEVAYMMSEAHRPDCEGGLRYDDPKLGLQWPETVKVISQRDLGWSLLDEAADNVESRMSASSVIASRGVQHLALRTR